MRPIRLQSFGFAESLDILRPHDFLQAFRRGEAFFGFFE